MADMESLLWEGEGGKLGCTKKGAIACNFPSFAGGKRLDGTVGRPANLSSNFCNLLNRHSCPPDNLLILNLTRRLHLQNFKQLSMLTRKGAGYAVASGSDWVILELVGRSAGKLVGKQFKDSFVKYDFLRGFQGKYPDQETQFVVFSGNSMNPTLRESDLMEVRSYRDRPICRGDVIYFLGQEKVPGIVHRVIGITDEGLLTQGDNNPIVDANVLQQEQVIGRVTAVWSGRKKRQVRRRQTGVFIR